MYLYRKNGLNRSAADDVRKLRKLADDLERLSAGHTPTDADLANAARVNAYEITARPVPVLYGLNEGHPNLVSDTPQSTQLWVLNQQEGWARTYSRYYRLGQSLKDAFGANAASWVGDTH